MPAYDGDGAAGEDQTGGYRYAHVNGLPQQEGRPVLCTAVADGGHAGVEVGAGVVGGLNGEDLVRESCQVVAGASVADAVEVDVAVDQSGKDGLAFVDDLLDGRSLRWDDGLLGPDCGDAIALEEDGAALQRGASGAVYEAVGGEESEVGGGVGHWWSPMGLVDFEHTR